MAQHKSAKKRIRQNVVRRLRNRHKMATTRSAIRNLRSITDEAEAREKLPEVYAMLDKVAKSNIIHKNKASNIKSKLAKHINGLSKK